MSEQRTIKAKCATAVLGLSKAGNEQAVLTFDTLDCGTLYYYGGCGEKSSEAQFKQTTKALRACGWRGDDLSDLSSAVGGEASLVLEEEEYKGEMHWKIRFVNALNATPALAADRARAFAAKMRARVAAASEGEKMPEQPSRLDDGPPFDDSDLPPF